MAKMNRRSFLKSSTAVSFGLVAGGKTIDLLAPRSAMAQEPVRILNGCTFSGAYAATGLYVSWGTKLAVKHFGGKVLGRPIEIIERNVPNPAEGVRKAQEAVERFGVKFLVISPTMHYVELNITHGFSSGQGRGFPERTVPPFVPIILGNVGNPPHQKKYPAAHFPEIAHDKRYSDNPPEEDAP